MKGLESRDRGMTLVEMIIVVTILGLITVVIAATFLAVLRITPSTNYRIDDARSTRGLQTWLARDVASTPPNVYDPGTGVGYVDSSSSPSAAGVPPGQLCTAGGTHVLFMSWKDGGASYRAQYVIEGNASAGYRVVRRICGEDTGQISLTGDVANDACAARPRSAVSITDIDLDLEPEASVALCFVSTQSDKGLLAGNSRQEIAMSVASRNGDM